MFVPQTCCYCLWKKAKHYLFYWYFFFPGTKVSRQVDLNLTNDAVEGSTRAFFTVVGKLVTFFVSQWFENLSWGGKKKKNNFKGWRYFYYSINWRELLLRMISYVCFCMGSVGLTAPFLNPCPCAMNWESIDNHG